MDQFYDYIYGFSSVIFFVRKHSIARNDLNLCNLCQKWIEKILSSNIRNIFTKNQSVDLFYQNEILRFVHQINGWYEERSTEKPTGYLNWNTFVENTVERMFIISKEEFNDILIPKVLILRNNQEVDLPIYEFVDTYFNYSWCYGAIGIKNFINLYLKNFIFSKELDNKLYEEYLKSTSTNYDKEIIVDHSICHGLSGLYYHLFVNKHLDSEALSKAIQNLLYYYENSTFISKDNFQLLEGNGGVLLVLLSLINKKRFIGDELFGYS